MALDPPRLPLALRVLNAGGGWLRAAGLPLVPLDEQELLARAREAAGLDDFGDESFHEGLGRLLHDLEHEARLTFFGRLTARQQILELLEGRLLVVDAWRKHPEILEQQIERPIFILGLPRTGTSILHELLALDPGNRVPMTWEVRRPHPPPRTATYDRDPRIAETAAHFESIYRAIPAFRTMHPMGAQLPQECVAITAIEFASMIPETLYRVPGYQRWLAGTDLRPAYRFHRAFLQYLGWQCPGERWVLKSPQHLWALDALLDVYPDACIIQCHRDPVRVEASLISLVTTLRALASDEIDPLEIGADWSKHLAEGLQRTIDARERAQLSDDRVVDVFFHEFMRDEIATIRRIYQRFGLELSAETEGRMRRFLADNAADKHGAHHYSLIDGGLDPDAERRRFARYQSRYPIPAEPVL
ncbi:MAG: sulfotransferase family protein [Myxococcota bacterium]